MRRPDIGTLPGAATLDDESFLDFVEGLRAFNLSRMVPRHAASADRLAPMLRERDPSSTVQTLFREHAQAPAAQFTRRMMRTLQQMMWRGTVRTYRRVAGELEQTLARSSGTAAQRLDIDPAFDYPQYARAQDIHLQPGGFQDEALAGYIYHYSSKIFFTGDNDDDHIHGVMAQWCPADTPPRVVLDVGCGIGQTTTALKQRFPQAQVIGVDMAAPLLRYAHDRALRMGVEVEFRQRSAAATGLADNSVDLVLAMILFHELPGDVAEGVVREAARVLRPGGTLTIVDFPHIPLEELSGRHTMRIFDTWFNGEPYAADFVHSDFTALLRRHFNDVNPNYRPAATSTGPLQIRVCRKS
ncbi:MAG: class I SAM-dependent methyltransferase [Steroidobacteraceae bacterium]